LDAPFDFTSELAIELPERLPPGVTEIRVETQSERFTSLHYFSLAPAPPSDRP
jgi:hypothetical protein